MVVVPVTLRACDAAIAPHVTDGVVPYDDCPLAVTPVWIHSDAMTEWQLQADEWCITHRLTGLKLPGPSFDTQDRAMAVLLRCQPEFAAWPLAGVNDAAKTACAVIYRGAMQ